LSIDSAIRKKMLPEKRKKYNRPIHRRDTDSWFINIIFRFGIASEINALLKRLPQKESFVLYQRHTKQKSMQAIADDLGVGYSVVSRTIKQAHRHFLDTSSETLKII